MIPDLTNTVFVSFFNLVVIGWFVLFFILLIFIYIKSFKPYRTSFNDEFYTKIPSDLNIIELSNLINRKLNANVLSAYVISLINNGILKFETFNEKQYLVRGNFTGTLSIGDEATMKLILYTMGDGSKVTIEELYNFCNRKKNKNILLMEYQIWCKIMRKENYKHIFYETKEQYSLVKFMSIIGCLLFFINLIFRFKNGLCYCTLIPALLLLFLFTKIYKRTREANEEYKKWIAFRSYLDNINSFDEKVTDPEQYIIYGTCLGVKGLERKITDHNYCEEITEALNRSIIKAILSGNRSL